MEWDQWLSHRMRMGRPHFYPFLEVLMHTVKGWWTLRSSSEDILQKTSQLSSFLSTPMLISWSFPSLSHCVSFLTALSLFSFSFFPFFFFFFWLCCVKRQRNQRPNYQHLLDHRNSKRVPGKHLLPLYWLCQSLWLYGSQQTGKFWKRWEYQTTWPAS